MSLHSYQVAKSLASIDRPFSSYVMAAMRKADSKNATKLQKAFPEIWQEYYYRYWSAGGLMPGESGYDESGDDNLQFRKEPDEQGL